MSKKEYIITIDLGTTLIKFIIYDSSLKRVAHCSFRYDMEIKDKYVEFDAEDYWNFIKENLKNFISNSGVNPGDISALGLSGQAESFVILDKNYVPLRRAISWLDGRSEKEVKELRNVFNEDSGYKITGQLKINTTWTVTKLLWIKKNEPQIFRKISKILLIKDYIGFKLTGLFISEYTTYNYSYYFNIFKKCYWDEILKYLGIEKAQLPELVEPGTNVGKLSRENIEYFNFRDNILLNIGANDQFSGMIGVGNIEKGIVSECTGTVLTIASIVDKDNLSKIKLPLHYGAIEDTFVCLMTCESGGVSLEWLKNNFFRDCSYKDLDSKADEVEGGSRGLIFFPYLVGSNPPEFEDNVAGAFMNLRIFHNENYFIRSVMEGIGYLIRKNLDYMKKRNIKTNNIISLGGGSKSDVWNQIKADITGKKVIVTTEDDPVGLGIGILIATKLGYYKNVREASDHVVKIKKGYIPVKKEQYELNYRKFLDYYKFIKNLKK
jgi:xylulokinase